MSDADDLAALRRMAELEASAKASDAARSTAASDNTSDLVKYGPGFVADSARKVGSAVLGGWDQLGRLAPDMPGGEQKSLFGWLMGDKLKNASKAVDVPDNPAAGFAENTYNKALRAGGAALSTPVPTGGVGRTVLANTVPAVAGSELGSGLSHIVPDWAKPYADIFGNVAGGMVGGRVMGPKQTAAQSDIRDVFRGTDPDTFIQAQRNAAEAEAAGSTTHTAAEAFPANHPVQGLASGVRSGVAGNDLAVRTSGRPEDLRQLGNTYIDRLGAGGTDPNRVANQASDSASDFLEGLKRSNTSTTGHLLQNSPPFDPRDVTSVYVDLHNQANNSALPGQRAAYRAVAEALTNGELGHNQHPLTAPQDISISLRTLRERAANPLAQGPVGPSAYSSHDINQAIGDAEAALRNAGPAGTSYGHALDRHGQFAEQVVDPAFKGPIGSMAPNNPNTAGQTPAGRLASVFGGGNSPQTVEDTANALNNRVMTGGNVTNPADIVRAISVQRMAKGTTNPGNTIRGMEGSTQQEQLEALLRAGGQDTPHIMQPLNVADRLQGNQNAPGVNQDPKMDWKQLAIRPFRTLDMAMTGNTRNTTSREAATLLADPSPQNIQRLQEIAMFDPNVRRALTLKGLINPMLQDKQEH